MIPRKGQRWQVLRGKVKKRKVVIVIDYIYRREPRSWADEGTRMKTRYWHEIGYHTEGTWANHGRRSSTCRAFLKFATPLP